MNPCPLVNLPDAKSLRLKLLEILLREYTGTTVIDIKESVGT